MERTITTFYQFADLSDFRDWKERLEETGIKEKVLGTIILAKEGINGTICGPKSGVDKFMAFIRSDERFAGMPSRSTFTSRETFYRLRIVTREEIVTLGVPGIDPTEVVGQYVEPEYRNALIKDPDVLLVEPAMIMKSNLAPSTEPLIRTLKTFPMADFVKESLEKSQKRKLPCSARGASGARKHLPTFCKTDSKKSIIFAEASPLPRKNPLRGKPMGRECFVFHHQVSVTHGLKDGKAVLCFGCRWPLTNEDLSSPDYEEGVSCPKCNGELSERKRESLRERQRQVELARKRRKNHIGQQMPSSGLR